MFDAILRLPQVKAATGLSRATIYLKASEGRFPRPVALGARAVGWPESEIAAMTAAWVRGASDEEISSLVRALELARKRAA
jgi:prophage regulatory protein